MADAKAEFDKICQHFGITPNSDLCKKLFEHYQEQLTGPGDLENELPNIRQRLAVDIAEAYLSGRIDLSDEKRMLVGQESNIYLEKRRKPEGGEKPSRPVPLKHVAKEKPEPAPKKKPPEKESPKKVPEEPEPSPLPEEKQEQEPISEEKPPSPPPTETEVPKKPVKTPKNNLRKKESRFRFLENLIRNLRH